MNNSTYSILLSLFLAVCSWTSIASAQTVNEPVAFINGDEIYQADIDYFLSLSPQAGRSVEAKKDALAQLVNNRLLVQSFFEESDYTEGDIKAISSFHALNGIAQLQLRKISENVQRSVMPNDLRIQSIILDNPAAFEDRKLITFIETEEFSASEEFWKSLEPLETLEGVVEQARAKEIDFTQQIVSVYSNTIQPSFRDVLLAAKLEDVLIFKQSNSDRGRLFVVKQVYDAPIIGAAAEAVAREILVQALQRQAVDNFLKEKSAASIITYSYSFSQLDDLPVGTTQEEVSERKRRFYYLLAGVFVLGAWGAITHVMTARCWNGRFYVPFSAWFSAKAEKTKRVLDLGVISHNSMEKSLGGPGKVVTFFISAMGWILFAVLVAVTVREDYRFVVPATVLAAISGLALTALVSTPKVLQVTSKHRVWIMGFCMSVYFAAAAMVTYLYYTYIGYS